MKFSRPWQKSQPVVAHVALGAAYGLPLYYLQTDLPSWGKIALIVATLLILVPTMRYLHRRFAKKFERILVCEYDAVARTVQRTLNAKRIPFTKRFKDDVVTFKLNRGAITLKVESFELNMPVDDHIKPIPGTRLTLTPESAENTVFLANLRQQLNESFQLQGW